MAEENGLVSGRTGGASEGSSGHGVALAASGARYTAVPVSGA